MKYDMNYFVSTFLISILLLSALPILGFAQESADVVVGKYVKIHSKILNEERTILVHLPSGYDQSKERYPVLYELDGEMTSIFTHSAATIGVMV